VPSSPESPPIPSHGFYYQSTANHGRKVASRLIIERMPTKLCEEFDKLNLRLVTNTKVVAMEVDSTHAWDIWKGQLEDKKIQEIKRNIKENKSPEFIEDE
jgi:hypothetical protein